MQGQQGYGMVNNQMPQYVQQPQYIQQTQYVQQPQYMQQPQYAQQPQYVQQPQYPQQHSPNIVLNIQQPQSQPGTASNVHREQGAMDVNRGHSRIPSGPREWKNSLCGCFDDMGSCCLTWCCPCIQYGKNYEKVHNSGCFSQCFLWCCLSCCGLQCCLHKELRSDVRQRYGLPEGCGDCLTTWCCGPCAICQEARELKDRG